jgi:hypothetical protein
MWIKITDGLELPADPFAAESRAGESALAQKRTGFTEGRAPGSGEGATTWCGELVAIGEDAPHANTGFV